MGRPGEIRGILWRWNLGLSGGRRERMGENGPCSPHTYSTSHLIANPFIWRLKPKMLESSQLPSFFHAPHCTNQEILLVQPSEYKLTLTTSQHFKVTVSVQVTVISCLPFCSRLLTRHPSLLHPLTQTQA